MLYCCARERGALMHPSVDDRSWQIKYQFPEPQLAWIEAPTVLLEKPLPDRFVAQCLSEPLYRSPVSPVEDAADHEAVVSAQTDGGEIAVPEEGFQIVRQPCILI
jgi:hypothetical protein